MQPKKQEGETMNKPDDDKEPFRVPVALFELGQVVATRGAIDACSRSYMQQCLARHVRDDWGVVSGRDSGTDPLRFRTQIAFARNRTAKMVRPRIKRSKVSDQFSI